MSRFIPSGRKACFGLSAADMVALEPEGVLLHRLVLEPWRQLQAAARKAGFEPKVISGFRDFERQKLIWHNKASGLRPILDDSGKRLEPGELSEAELLLAIMRFSAVPGASRHHWGSDFDVYDASAVDADYQVQLTPQEVADDGVFGAFHLWLDGYLSSEANPGFFRPYQIDRGGIAPERWHLSYAPLAAEFQQQLSPQALLDLWHEREVDLLGKLESNLDALWHSHIWVDWSLYPCEFRPC